MKRLFFSLFALLSGMMVTQAQVVIKPAVGVNFTDLSKDEGGEFKAKTGWQLGGYVMLSEHKWYLEPGIFYIEKSTKFDSSGNSGSHFDFNISGFRIPVSIGYNFGDEKSTVNFRVFGGGSAFIMTNTTHLNKDDLKSAQWGVYAGAGLDFSLIFIDASYEWSLTDFSDVDNVDIGKTRTIFIHAGIRLKL